MNPVSTCSECRAPVNEESQACPECFAPLCPEDSNPPFVEVLQASAEPVPPPREAAPETGVSLRSVAYSPTSWWTRVGRRWLRTALVLLLPGLLILASPVMFMEYSKWQALAEGKEQLTLARAARQAGREGEAALWAGRAASSLKAAHQPDLECQAEELLAELAEQKGDLESAIPHYSRCAKLDHKGGFDRKVAELKGRLAQEKRALANRRIDEGRAHLAQREYSQAATAGQQAVDLLLRYKGSKSQLANAHRLLGHAYYRMASPVQAREHLSKSLKYQADEPTEDLLAELTPKQLAPRTDFSAATLEARHRAQRRRSASQYSNYAPSSRTTSSPRAGYPTYQPPPPTYNYTPPTYQPQPSTYQPPQSNYQPPQSNYQPPRSTYQPPQSNYQPPQPPYPSGYRPPTRPSAPNPMPVRPSAPNPMPPAPSFPGR